MKSYAEKCSRQRKPESLSRLNFVWENLILIYLGFSLLFFITINNDVAPARTVKDLYNNMPSNIVEILL